MSNFQNITQEICRIEVSFLNVKQEIKTLKNRVRGYKGWTKRYRKKQKELKQANLAISKERDQAIQDFKELQIKQQCLLKSIAEAEQAIELRDKARFELNNIIAKIEQYREICITANKISYADKEYLIKEAEKLFFEEEIPTVDVEFNSDSKPQMFEDKRSIVRYLLDR